MIEFKTIIRPIEFRGKSKKDGRWIFGCLMNFKPEEKIFIQEWDFMLNPEEIESITLGQFTGKFDCKGNKIFEGDILQFDCEIDGEIFVGNYEVEWSMELCGFILKSLNVDEITEFESADEMIVVGNKFDKNYINVEE